jgi:hypothetical protein
MHKCAWHAQDRRAGFSGGVCNPGDCRDQATEKKKEEFPGIMETCRLGTPFPRSALFLIVSLRDAG